ncbi:hypothetical protein D3C87_1098940 [compost metagenome]
MQCLNLHQALLKEEGWIEPKLHTPPTKMELAQLLYKEHDGAKEPIVAELMRAGVTKSGASTYYMNVHMQEQTRHRVLTLGSSMRTIDIASEPVKRTIVVMLEMELTEEEDTYQTAELAVDLLNQNLSNDIKLVAATEKH